MVMQLSKLAHLKNYPSWMCRFLVHGPLCKWGVGSNSLASNFHIFIQEHTFFRWNYVTRNELWSRTRKLYQSYFEGRPEKIVLILVVDLGDGNLWFVPCSIHPKQVWNRDKWIRIVSRSIQLIDLINDQVQIF